MKFEDLPMDKQDSHQKRVGLEEEVAKLQDELEKEQKLHQILQCAVHGPFVCHSCVSSLVPLQVQVLLAELAMVEEEIITLERKIEDLKMCIYQERKQKKERRFRPAQQHQWWQRQQRHFLCGFGGRREIEKLQQLPGLQHEDTTADDETERSRRCSEPNRESSHHTWQWCRDEEAFPDTPNQVSEELIGALVSIFHTLSQRSSQLECEPQNSAKLHISCMRSNSSVSRSSHCKTSTSSSKDASQKADGTGRDMGSNQKLVNVTQASLDMSRISLCIPTIGKLRALIHKLCAINPSFLTYKQKLAFWINIYNACIMHAFLLHGLPSSPEKLLALLNKATINVGGVVLNALAIEHFLLRHSFESESEAMNEKEGLLRHAYGLGYPEPNVTFALCRGSWSSPALRVYTAEDVVNELERAKIEYLETSVSITSKKKVIVPKLLHWHMRDFADDMESLLEWIYSQLPRSGSLKRLLKECLSRDPRIPLAKMVVVQPYRAEFRYLLPSPGAAHFMQFF
ncbi:hypothetical protein MUK42_35378 [Musa troglodytarum]|uniref:DUF547 domain-containing protein n=1 Tax=Musa troglodytarum TaxID=320322 RepID=A0A9E7L175_9LILI|nr:hypothetical protein MUK42_35378 [Musa troglodytarum]